MPLTPNDLKSIETLLDKKLDAKFKKELTPIKSRLTRFENRTEARFAQLDNKIDKLDRRTEKVENGLSELKIIATMNMSHLTKIDKKTEEFKKKLTEIDYKVTVVHEKTGILEKVAFA